MAKCERLERYLVTVTTEDIRNARDADTQEGIKFCDYFNLACEAALRKDGLWERFVTWGADSVSGEDEDYCQVAVLRAAREGAE